MYFNILFISQGTKYSGETWDMDLCVIWTKCIKDFNGGSFIPAKYVDHLPIDCSQEILSVIKSSVKLLVVVLTTVDPFHWEMKETHEKRNVQLQNYKKKIIALYSPESQLTTRSTLDCVKHSKASILTQLYFTPVLGQ